MNSPQSHKDIENTQIDSPQSHGDTKNTRMDLPRSHRDTESTRIDLPPGHRVTENTRIDLPRSHRDTESTRIDLPPGHGDTELTDLNGLTSQIIRCAIDVHRAMGPGLLEAIYESAMCIEFEDSRIRYLRQTSLPAYYKGRLLGEYRVDLIVEDSVLVEIKSVERPVPVFEAQLLTYLRLTEKRVGLLINFNSRLVKDGIKRIIL